jgi:hypothetical protein
MDQVLDECGKRTKCHSPGTLQRVCMGRSPWDQEAELGNTNETLTSDWKNSSLQSEHSCNKSGSKIFDGNLYADVAESAINTVRIRRVVMEKSAEQSENQDCHKDRSQEREPLSDISLTIPESHLANMLCRDVTSKCTLRRFDTYRTIVSTG